MTFEATLNAYLEQLDCTARELSEASGLSQSVISRYRNGSRIPETDGIHLRHLAGGIARLAAERGMASVTESSVLLSLEQSLKEGEFPYALFQQNLNLLISTLSINVTDLARAMNYDTSYLSRVRNGQRHPAEPEKFAGDIARYVARRYGSDANRAALAQMMGVERSQLNDPDSCIEQLTTWLTDGNHQQKDLVYPFLLKVDEFDLNEFIRSIHYDEMKVPTVPFQLPTAKNYYGLEEMCQAELDFFKAVVTSRSMEPLIMQDDTPMAEKANGTDFKQKFIFAVALALRKGLHIHFIHNVNRPFEEMMMGLEGWIPMYMTGQISPYYLKGAHNGVFGHFLFSGGTAALAGECIMGNPGNGKMYLTKQRTETAYYRQRAQDLLAKASPLMDIFTAEQEKGYQAFWKKDRETPGIRRSLLSAPPLYTLTDSLLERILEPSGLSEALRERIRMQVRDERNAMETVLQRDTVIDEIPFVTQEEFAAFPIRLPLAGMFLEQDVFYTYNTYRDHLAACEDYAEQHPNYTIRNNTGQMFRNIQIRILEGHWAEITKNKAPAIHFVIRHPKLLDAIEHFRPGQAAGNEPIPENAPIRE